ncbi:PTS lactose transporter subunit IIB [Oenococcus oeni]|uniref:PTS lactose transporter subunit IIB n=1 Tax=Oenococcus oeni TaxID=1247 RepID=UPI0008F92AFF|nr:PTS lactose transporter subunit IIB [Oenococcus oeni]OIK85248.1 PTS lactose transporter subunit IIB [Oenococcus oeni]OIL08286.1 PTS lactose transporter subunit IIB [Oenococcus oeni]OIL11282.1 PTS lactose transporter subunit IIB [Oenococcus oeni]SYW05536.1 PTS lactose transporter subunit IIB [Oenococcus oeni]
MNNQKTVIVCCASSMITSTVAAGKVREFASNNGLPEPNIIQCKFSEVEGEINTNKIDFIVPTGKLDETVTHGIKTISGTPFVTGVNEDQAEAEIVKALKM